MRPLCLVAALAISTVLGMAQTGPYKVLKTAKVGGDGGFDYVYADSDGRRLYIARSGPMGRLTVFNLDTLEPAGEIADVSAHGAAVSTKTGHGFATSKPVAMFDSKTETLIKKIEVQGGPDGMLYDSFNDRIWILSHSQPNATVINAADGTIAGTLDLGGAPEQGQSDGKGHLYIDIEDKDNVAVVDAKTLTVTGHYDLAGKGGQCAGLGLDIKNGILFAACRNPQNMVILSAKDGKILETLPIGRGTDGAGFNAGAMEAFSSQGDGTLTIIKENSPTSFAVEQTVETMNGAKTMTIDSKTGHVLLIAAEYGPPPAAPATPAPAPGGAPGGGRGRGPRAPMIPGSFSIIVVGK
jgi:hypothetical protein